MNIADDCTQLSLCELEQVSGGALGRLGIAEAIGGYVDARFASAVALAQSLSTSATDAFGAAPTNASSTNAGSLSAILLAQAQVGQSAAVTSAGVASIGGERGASRKA